MRIISYSLFGYDKERFAGCDTFHSYLRGLMINVRLAKLLFPEWKIRVHMDNATYTGLQRFWELLSSNIHANEIQIVKCDDAELTKAMLWRLKPAYDKEVTMFICRDTDAPLTYRDAQAVKEWELSPKQAHAITDSVSHTIPMMGGMIGFKTKYFKDYVKQDTWLHLVNQGGGYHVKGADQDFLGAHVYPKFAGENSSIMQHYYLGMRNTFIDGYLTCSCVSVQGHKEDCPRNIKLNLPDAYKETNLICGHIGAAGNYEVPTYNFLGKHYDKFEGIRKAEDLHRPEIFNWNI